LFESSRIKNKIKSADIDRWWGDDFDVRFYLISKIKHFQKKIILDVGGGIGIISSEINDDNIRINLDLSFNDLKICQKNIDKKINVVCGSMTNLPFKEGIFDVIICSNLLEEAKKIDIQEERNIEKSLSNYPTIEKTLEEIRNILKKNGVLYLTTPNNKYYNTIKLTFQELNYTLNKKFSEVKIYFFNTYPKLGNNRKLNFANIIPKLKSKTTNPDKIIQKLVKTKSRHDYSVSFYVEAKND
jgi:ubiquinone/menaquinone biosynthesis C-methylase UbiE